MFFLAMLSRGMRRSIAEELFLLLPSFFLSFFLYICVSRRRYVSSRLREKKWIWSFSPGDCLTCVCYRVYIHNVYKHKSSIYIIHIYLSIPCISMQVRDTRVGILFFLFIYYAYLLPLYLFLFSREYNKGLRIM